MQTKKMKLADLSQDPANARRHGKRNLEAIKASLRRFGQQTPIVVDKSNVVRKGNGTLEAAIDLGWEEIDVIQTSLTSGDAIAYAIADNRTSELAEWDDEILAAQLNGLLTEDKDLLAAAGFTVHELEGMIEMQDEWHGRTGEGIDEIPEYDPANETVSIRVNKVRVDLEDGIVDAINAIVNPLGFKVEVF